MPNNFRSLAFGVTNLVLKGKKKANPCNLSESFKFLNAIAKKSACH